VSFGHLISDNVGKAIAVPAKGFEAHSGWGTTSGWRR
jgi:hypothetical protein